MLPVMWGRRAHRPPPSQGHMTYPDNYCSKEWFNCKKFMKMWSSLFPRVQCNFFFCWYFKHRSRTATRRAIADKDASPMALHWVGMDAYSWVAWEWSQRGEMAFSSNRTHFIRDSGPSASFTKLRHNAAAWGFHDPSLDTPREPRGRAASIISMAPFNKPRSFSSWDADGLV